MLRDSRETSFARYRVHDQALRIVPQGPSITAREADVLTREMTEELTRQPEGLRYLVIDLKDVTFMASAGLGLCVELGQTMRTRGGETVLVGLNDDIRKIFEVTGLGKRFIMLHDRAKLDQYLDAAAIG